MVVQSRSNTIQENSNEQFVVGSVLRRAGVNQKKRENLDSDNESLATISSKSSVDDQRQLSSPGNVATISTEKDGLQYLAGWVAKKLKTSHPELGHYTYQNENKTFHSTYSLPSWLKFLSFGGLTEPTSEFMADCLELEKLFCKYFGNGLNKTPGICKIICKKIKKKKNIDDIIIQKFVRQRIFIRINYINMKNEEEKKNKYRKRAATDSVNRKSLKKMKKIVL